MELIDQHLLRAEDNRLFEVDEVAEMRASLLPSVAFSNIIWVVITNVISAYIE